MYWTGNDGSAVIFSEAPGEPRPQEFQLRVQNSIFWSESE